MPTYKIARPVTNRENQIIGFVKDQGIWFADLPEFLSMGLGSRTNLMMVDGADTFLDFIGQGQHRVTLTVSTQAFKGYLTKMVKSGNGLNPELLKKIGHAPVDYGAYYSVTEFNSNPYKHQLWLCPVAEYVFGCYPEEIFASVHSSSKK